MFSSTPPATTLRPGRPEEVGMSTPRLRHVAELGQEWVREGIASSLVLLVARRGRVVLHEAYGHLTPDENSPPTPLDALYPLASVGKVFTATALMVLVEEGRVGLNRPVSTYLPEFQGEGKDRVLVRHLLTHTSGIKDEEVEKYAKEQKGKIPLPPADETIHPLLQEFFALRFGCPLWKPPGEEMSYSPYGFELVGEIVRRVSRAALDRFARARVFQPLGMNDTFSCPVDAPSERRIQRAPDPTYVIDALDEAHEKERLAWGSGGELSTAKDLAIFGQMFLNGGAYGTERVLSPASVKAMTSNQIPGIGARFRDLKFPEASWGLGWSVHGSKTGMCGGLYSPQAFEHWGAGGLYFWVDPVYELVGVYLSTDPVYLHPEVRAAPWRNDLFTDGTTAAILEP
jgi:serine-type D-Ala-D-Ala carboxypeptidase